MLRAMTLTEAMYAIAATSVVRDDREAQLRLRTALTAFDYDGCVVDALVDMLASGEAILRLGRHDRHLILWVRTGEVTEAWFAVEPTGLCCLITTAADGVHVVASSR
jgi:hypothetical protein